MQETATIKVTVSFFLVGWGRSGDVSIASILEKICNIFMCLFISQTGDIPFESTAFTNQDNMIFLYRFVFMNMECYFYAFAFNESKYAFILVQGQFVVLGIFQYIASFTSRKTITDSSSRDIDRKIMFDEFVITFAAVSTFVIKVFQRFKPLIHCQVMAGARLFSALVLPLHTLFN